MVMALACSYIRSHSFTRPQDQGCGEEGVGTQACTDNHKMIHLLVQELLLFRFSSFQIVSITHLYYTNAASQATSPNYKEKIITKNKETEKQSKAKRRQKDLALT